MIFSTEKNLPVLNIPQYIREITCTKRDRGLTVKTRHSTSDRGIISNAELSFVTFTGEGNEVRALRRRTEGHVGAWIQASGPKVTRAALLLALEGCFSFMNLIQCEFILLLLL